jgi:hypothetical protein
MLLIEKIEKFKELFCNIQEASLYISVDQLFYTGADPGFQVRVDAL